MRYLILAVALLVTGCPDNPDFWTCQEGNQEKAREFYRTCTRNFEDMGGTKGEECKRRMQEIHCTPGYKEQLVKPDGTEESIPVAETTQSIIDSFSAQDLKQQSTETKSKTKW